MCQQVQELNNNTAQKMKPSYSIKKVLKTLFKKQQKQQQKLANSVESFESMENERNMQAEQHFYYEIEDNSANEKLAYMVAEEQQYHCQKQQQIDEEDIYVPVRFARTEAGTFFWTTNLQPVTSSIAPSAVDEDLAQAAYCYTNYQYPVMQFQDRWAQA